MSMSSIEENKVIIDGQTYYGGLNQPNLKFIKVNVDCWEKIFDVLSLRDILAMSQTCQRMRQICGHYFRQNFHGTAAELSGSTRLRMFIDYKPIGRDDFLRFVDTLNVHDKLNYLRTVTSTGVLSSLTTLRLLKLNLLARRLRGFENIQANIETIYLSECIIDEESFGDFLASCPKLSCLRFNDAKFKPTKIQNSLFRRKFPKLEYFECSDHYDAAQLISFLKRNPNIKFLRTTNEVLEEIPLRASTVRLDYLDIDVNGEADADKLLNQLKTLHGNGFFKKLRLSFRHEIEGFDADMFFREITSINALETLHTSGFYCNAMNHLTQLKELHLKLLNEGTNLEMIAMNLINLERLRIGGTVKQLSSFLRHAKGLKFVIFHDNNAYYNTLNLFNLNRVRQMEGMERKVQIGVYGGDYLKIKWKGNNVNYDLVEITRVETIRKYFHYK